jgi:hypothetical protein
MPAVGNEKNFPRKDNAFKAKESLSYEETLSAIYENREVGRFEKQIEIFCYFIMGFLIALTAWVMDIIEESLIHFKDHWTQDQI